MSGVEVFAHRIHDRRKGNVGEPELAITDDAGRYNVTLLGIEPDEV